MAPVSVTETGHHCRAASQELQPALVKRARNSLRGNDALAKDLAIEGLRRVYGPTAQPQTPGQAQALELIHKATVQEPLIIVLGTGSGKSVLFLSIAALLVNQTVIVIVPFVALLQDILQRAQRHQITCEEWRHQQQWRRLPQLIVVSADQAISDSFLHFAKGLELHQQLVHIFFDECHVAVTDTSYRQRLQELWQLRYL